MKLKNIYRYPTTVRETIDGKRHYAIKSEKLPSVTTILSATESAEKREALAKWRQAKGEEIATRIVDESAARGTAMHKILEKYILEEGYLDLTTLDEMHTIWPSELLNKDYVMFPNIMEQNVLCIIQDSTPVKQI